MFTRKDKKSVLKYVCLIMGAAILAFGLFNVHSQSMITEGGVLGMMLLLEHFTDISPSITGPVMDGLCYLAGFFIIGKDFLKKAVIASLSFAGFYKINEQIGYVLPSLSDRPILAAVAGGLFVGIGVGLIVRAGGASGGDDALALMISKLAKCKLEHAYFITDAVVLLASLSYVPLPKILCSLITVTISSYIIGQIHTVKIRWRFHEKCR